MFSTTDENVAVPGQVESSIGDNDDSPPPPQLLLQQQESRGARKSSYVPQLHRLSGVEITEPTLEPPSSTTTEPQEYEIFPAAAPEIVKRQSSLPPPSPSSPPQPLPPPQLQVTSSSFRPARGTFQITGAESLSITQMEEPMEPVTASSAHDLSSSERGGGGTERSEDDSVLLLVSPTSVATRKISRALLRDVSMVKVQEPNLLITPTVGAASAVDNHNNSNNYHNNSIDNNFAAASTTTFFGASNYHLSSKFEVEPVEPPPPTDFSKPTKRPSLPRKVSSKKKKKSHSIERKVSGGVDGGGGDYSNDAMMATDKFIDDRRRQSSVTKQVQPPRQQSELDDILFLPEIFVFQSSKQRTNNTNTPIRATALGAAASSSNERKILRKKSKRQHVGGGGGGGDGRLADAMATDEYHQTLSSSNLDDSQNATMSGSLPVSPSERKISRKNSRIRQQSSDGRFQNDSATDEHYPALSDSNHDDSQRATVPGAFSVVAPPSERKISRKDSRHQQLGSDGRIQSDSATDEYQQALSDSIHDDYPRATVPGAFSAAPSERKISRKDSKRRHGSDGRMQSAIDRQTSDEQLRRQTLVDFNNDDSQRATVPGAVPVSPKDRKTSLKESLQRYDEGLLQDAVDIKSGELHRRQALNDSNHDFPRATVPGAVPVSPRQTSLKESLQRHDDGLLQDAIDIKSGELHRRRTSSYEAARGSNQGTLPGAVPVSPKDRKTSLKESLQRHDEGLLQDAIAIKTGEHHRRRTFSNEARHDSYQPTSPGAVPVSPKGRSISLQLAMDGRVGVLQDDIAIKTGELHRRQTTSFAVHDSQRATSPGVVPISPRGRRSSLKETMQRHDDGLLQDAIAIKTGEHHRRRVSNESTNNVTRTPSSGVVPMSRSRRRSTLKESMQQHDDGLLHDAIAIKSGEHHRRNRRSSVRRTPGEHVGVLDSPQASESINRSRRKSRRASQATAAEQEAALNAKMEEYDDLVRRKDEAGDSEDDDDDDDVNDVERQQGEDNPALEHDLVEGSLEYPYYDPITPTFPTGRNSTAENDQARENDDDAGSHDIAIDADVQPYSEWEAKKRAALMRKRRCRIVAAAVVILAIVGAVIGVVVALTSKDDSSKKTAPNSSPTTAPTVDLSSCNAGDVFSERYNTLRPLVVNNSLGETAQVDVSGSIQRKALCWIADGDRLQLVAEASNLPAILQRYTLAVLYYGMVDITEPQGLAKTNFLTPVNECMWEGIICNKTDTVTFIEIYKQYLVGTVPAEIGNLNSTEILDFNNNAITGFPTDVWRLSRLVLLDFGINNLAMSIPSDVAYLTNLRWFKFESNNNINGTLPSELFSLSNLELISLQTNSITGKLPVAIEANNNSSLKTLYLAGNRLSGTIPSNIGFLTKLESLDLTQNFLTGTIPTTLGNLIYAKSIKLESNSLRGSMPAEVCNLRDLGTLQELTVDSSLSCSCCTPL